MPFLRHWVNGNAISLYELGKTITLGRAKTCHIQLDDGTVSSAHAEIRPAGAGYEVADLGSTNGLRVNGEKVNHALLQAGDRLTIGTHEFEYLLQLPNNLDRTQKIRKSWIPGVYYTE
ncbi:FHA domain-containing protein [Exilibacterium tricleocarpae]|uniref:FHA domain-containing protein n=1 Tax=Exilibacterium tricleocarpae TaxID=2591008 RepID=A0A545SSP3_9GAMM|nr:FHA domain-containing protein [Exilibacterium tricleocarpae]TQV67982.1 FHA domain-containing protein [Exilibacterium tricleocarpae]